MNVNDAIAQGMEIPDEDYLDDKEGSTPAMREQTCPVCHDKWYSATNESAFYDGTCSKECARILWQHHNSFSLSDLDTYLSHITNSLAYLAAKA